MHWSCFAILYNSSGNFAPVFATNKNVKSELITIWWLVFSRAWSDLCLLQIFIGCLCYFLSSHWPIWLRLVCRSTIKCERLIFLFHLILIQKGTSSFSLNLAVPTFLSSSKFYFNIIRPTHVTKRYLSRTFFKVEDANSLLLQGSFPCFLRGGGGGLPSRWRIYSASRVIPNANMCARH